MTDFTFKEENQKDLLGHRLALLNISRVNKLSYLDQNEMSRFEQIQYQFGFDSS